MDEKNLLCELEKYKKIADECEDDTTASEALKAFTEIYLKLSEINIIKYGFDAYDQFEMFADWQAHEMNDIKSGVIYMKTALKLICLLADIDETRLNDVGYTCSELSAYMDEAGGDPDADTFEQLSKIFFSKNPMDMALKKSTLKKLLKML